MSKKRSRLWIDSETDSSTTSDHHSHTASINGKLSTGESTEASKRNCCLICSILSSLSNINCCQKHLALLTTVSPTQVIYMMLSSVQNQDQCSKSKQKHRRYRALSSTSQLWRKQRPVTLTSFSTTHKNEYLLSPNRERSTSTSIESRSNQLNHLSSSSAKSTMNNNNSQRQHRTLSSPFVAKRKRQTKSFIRNDSISSMTNQSTSTDSVTEYSPRILLKRVIHVKDDDEELTVDPPQIILNMSQATKQMTAEKHGHPKILLKRVCLEQ